jgi:hypothetical protein
MENNNENSSLTDSEEKNSDDNINSNIEEEYTPKLFSDDDQSKVEDNLEEDRETNTEKLFDQETNEEEDFEIPAFLRKQKF